jgi:anti-sigma factor RsiW
MNAESLHALTIDRHFGELSQEAAELLDHYLAQNPAARTESERILESVAATGDALARHAELVRVSPVLKPRRPAAFWRSMTPALMRSAALVLLALTAAAVGYVAGRSTSASSPDAPVVATAAQTSASGANAGPWARYRVS